MSDEALGILNLAIDRASAVNTYWNIYIGVATALLGIMASGKAFTASRTLKTILSVAFAVFAYSNLAAIMRLGDLREALLAMLPAGLTGREILIASLSPASKSSYTAFHIILDAAVIIAIWWVPWPSPDKPSGKPDSLPAESGG